MLKLANKGVDSFSMPQNHNVGLLSHIAKSKYSGTRQSCDKFMFNFLAPLTTLRSEGEDTVSGGITHKEPCQQIMSMKEHHDHTNKGVNS